MGIPTWRLPLPPTATRAEMEADLAALRREIRNNAIVHATSLGIGIAALIATLGMVAIGF